LVQKLALADSALPVIRSSEAFYRLLAGPGVEPVGKIAVSSSNIAIFYLVFGVKIVTEVINLCFFVDG